MGETKHICYCQSRQCKSLTGKKDKQMVTNERTQLRENIKQYLSEEPCVGVGFSELPKNATAERFCEVYTKAINFLHQSQQKRSSEESMQLSALLGDLFAGFWGVISSLSVPSEKYRLNSVTALRKIENDSFLNNEVQKLLNEKQDFQADTEAGEINETASLLSQGFIRALGELEHASKGNDPSIIMHHMALVGDILHEMLRLVINLNPDRFTEERLPDSHPHARIRERYQTE